MSERLRHDQILKKSMAIHEVAVDFIKTHAPDYIKSKANFDTLKLEKETYIDDDRLCV